MKRMSFWLLMMLPTVSLQAETGLVHAIDPQRGVVVIDGIEIPLSPDLKQHQDLKVLRPGQVVLFEEQDGVIVRIQTQTEMIMDPDTESDILDLRRIPQ